MRKRFIEFKLYPLVKIFYPGKNIYFEGEIKKKELNQNFIRGNRFQLYLEGCEIMIGLK